MRRVVWALVALMWLSPSPGLAGEPVKKGTREPHARLLADATSGRVLREQGADESLPLGSLGHLMLALLALERVAAGALTWEQAIPVSAAAVAVPGARLALHEGEQVAVAELLRALIVADAPDAAMVLAEALAETPAGAVAAMNERAHALGMIGTEYGSLGGTASSTRQPVDVTTARDTARVTTALLRYPQVADWAALSGIPFRGGAVLLRNRNQLLGAVPGVNGLLVTDSPRAGFHLVATARRGAFEIVAVTLGAADNESRYTASAEWLEWGFNTFERIEIVRAGEPLPSPMRVRAGVEGQLIPVAAAGCSVLRRHDEERHFEVGFQLPEMLSAPIVRSQRLGEIVVRENDRVLAVVPAVSPVDVPVAEGAESATGTGP